jgi:CoA-transferase family III
LPTSAGNFGRKSPRNFQISRTERWFGTLCYRFSALLYRFGVYIRSEDQARGDLKLCVTPKKERPMDAGTTRALDELLWQLGLSRKDGGATQGSLDSPQCVPTGFLADYLAAYLGAAGVLATLIRRAREGGSCHVKVSLACTAMWVLELGLVEDRAAAMALAMPLPRESDLTRISDTPYGELEFAAPVTQ